MGLKCLKMGQIGGFQALFRSFQVCSPSVYQCLANIYQANDKIIIPPMKFSFSVLKCPKLC